MNDHEYNRERLRQQRLQRLGSDHPRCIVCDEDDPCCLELHHLASKDFGDDQVIVCRNHHRKLSDMQKEHPPASTTPTTLEGEGHLQLGIADLMELLKVPPQLVDLIRQSGRRLIERGQLFNRSDDGEEP